MRLGVKVGRGCATLLDSKMRNFTCRHLRFDEIWGFIGKKEKHVRPDDDAEVGDVWSLCAIDADTNVVPTFKVGRRDAATANAFVNDISARLKNRVQIWGDALRAYLEAMVKEFRDLESESEAQESRQAPASKRTGKTEDRARPAVQARSCGL